VCVQDLSYEDFDEEHRKLLKVIRESQSETRREPRSHNTQPRPD
jgi:hypothetical protein